MLVDTQISVNQSLTKYVSTNFQYLNKMSIHTLQRHNIFFKGVKPTTYGFFVNSPSIKMKKRSFSCLIFYYCTYLLI